MITLNLTAWNSYDIAMVATLCISILLILFTIIHSRNSVLKIRSKAKEYEQQVKILQMTIQMMEMQQKNDRDSLINLALHLKSYIEYIIPIKNDIKKALDLPEEEQKNKFKSIYNSMQNNFHLHNNMEMVQDLINKIYKDFLKRLEDKYPNITKSEKRLCSMIYINMSSKEIAMITGTSLRSVETSRYRLRKKFNMARDEDMIRFLREI